ncbi:MAG: hypothetical protein SGCHY_003405 [Lobulomycetales sp.]
MQYLRYAALGLGVTYGIYRNASLASLVKQREILERDHAHDLLVEEGRIAYEASLAREEGIQGAKSGIVTDSDSYRFDFDTWQEWSIAQMDEREKREKAAGKKI